jgi:acyl phosphate:glycerol-3-phosphate acyltransferase
MSPAMMIAAAAVLGYLLGSIPFGLVITRFAGTEDIRKIGSGNIGATNVLRTGNKFLAGLTFLGDMLKGTLAVLVAGQLWGPNAAMAAGLFAFLGHLFPVWLGFRGGKGVSTYIGVALGLFWPAALIFCVLWIAVAASTRYSSVASLTGSLLAPVFAWHQGHPMLALLFLAMTVLLWFMHRGNIMRLLAGTEGRIGQKG